MEEDWKETFESLDLADGQRVVLPAGSRFYISMLGKAIISTHPVSVQMIYQDFSQLNVRILEDINGEKTTHHCGWVNKDSINGNIET